MDTLTIPEGFTLHSENTARILLPSTNEAFLNPVQEFNRDLSVACITAWSEERERQKETQWRQKTENGGKGVTKRKKQKKDATDERRNQAADVVMSSDVTVSMHVEDAFAVNKEAGPSTSTSSPTYEKNQFVLLEALSATGLRSIRYAKEIPLVKYVIANDLSPAAVQAIKRNVELNGLGPLPSNSVKNDGETHTVGSMVVPSATNAIASSLRNDGAKIHINEGDACALMYSHRAERQRVDCVDLDPYGSAAPFIDAAVQCVNDGGLLCVTCTDLAVLATNNYPEKCFANYGGIPVKAEYCHEAALRLVLHSLSASAARYGRYVHPLLSLSIDFYVRLFVRVQTAPIEVKKAASKTSTFYICSNCQSHHEQPLGKIVERASNKSGQINVLYRQRTGPPVGEECPECGSALHVAGPMWSGPIHDVDFVAKVLEHVDSNDGKYGTATRMKGMLTVAKEELSTPFYFTPSRVAGHFHCISPSLEDVANALLHAGHSISRSHAMAGSLKTTATRRDVHDVFRCWIKKHPVKPESVSPTSPSAKLHAQEPRFEADFAHHPLSVTQSSKVKLVRYQQNPTSHWGPGTRAGTKPGKKRKHNEAAEEDVASIEDKNV